MNRDGQRGIALLVVLWVSVLLALIAALLVSTSRTESDLARNLAEAARARAAAEAAVMVAIKLLLDAPDASARPGDGRAIVLEVPHGAAVVRIEDEAGKINLNLAPPELLQGLLTLVGLDRAASAALADAIVDWRDRDQVRRPAGAEDEEYRAAGLPQLPRNGAFERLDELRLVLGMNEAIFRRVAPLVSAVSRQRLIDPYTAPLQALLAVPGINAAEVQELMAMRADTGDAGQARRDQRLPTLSGVARYVGGQSPRDTFTIRAEARTPSGAAFTREVVVRLQPRRDPPYRFVDWREGSAADIPR